MKKLAMILPLVVVFCFVVGCQDKEAMAELEQFKAQAALEEANKAVVMRLGDAYQNHDIEAAREIFSPDYISHDPQNDMSLEESLESMKHQFAMYPDWNLSAEDLFAKGDKVVWRGTVRGTNTGDIEGFPATGNKIEISANVIFRVENGRIVEDWFEYDMLGWYQQLGFELKPKEEK